MPELTIERQSHDGRGIARQKGKTTFVEGALAGETVQARITKKHRRFDEAVCEEILTPSPQRIEPDCEYYAKCGGCSLQHLGLEQQREVKRDALVDQLQRFGKIEHIPLHEPLLDESWGYRRKARLGVKWNRHGELIIGFREKASPHLTPIQHCKVLMPQLSALIPSLYELIPELESKKTIGHLELAQGDEGSAIVVRHLKKLSHRDLTLWQGWAQTHNTRLYLQQGDAHSLTSPDHEDAQELHYKLEGLKLAFLPNDFVQVNPAINAQMVQRALEWLAPTSEDVVLDLFAGFGNFSLPVARHGAKVVGIEGEQALVNRAKENAASNGIENAEFYRADLSQSFKDLPWAKQGYNLLILDPPRTGAQNICQQIAQFKVKRLVYVSCNPSTLARDSAILVQQGYKLQKTCIMDMFPHTTHVESMALFERA